MGQNLFLVGLLPCPCRLEASQGEAHVLLHRDFNLSKVQGRARSLRITLLDFAAVPIEGGQRHDERYAHRTNSSRIEGVNRADIGVAEAMTGQTLVRHLTRLKNSLDPAGRPG